MTRSKQLKHTTCLLAIGLGMAATASAESLFIKQVEVFGDAAKP